MIGRILRALATAILIGGYAGWCLFIGLSLVSAAITPLQKPMFFYTTLAVLSKIAMGRIFYVQIKKPSS